MKQYLYLFLISTSLSFSQSTINWGSLWHPQNSTNGSTTFYAQVYEPGVTPGPTNAIAAWIGYSTENTNPNTDNGSWTWVSASYNATSGNNNEYMATLTPPPGTYYVASRFELNSEGSYYYGGYQTTWNNNSATITHGVYTTNDGILTDDNTWADSNPGTTISSDITIGHDVTLTGDLTINSGITVFIEAGASLIVTGNITNNGTIVVDSNSDKFGVIYSTGTNDFDIEIRRWVNTQGSSEWDLIGPSVKNLTLTDFINDNNNLIATNGSSPTTYAVGYYLTHNNSWINYNDNTLSGNSLSPSRGYQMASVSGNKLIFKGEYVLQAHQMSITNHASGSGSRWNLVANPFSSYIGGNDDTTAGNLSFLDVSDLDSSFGGIYGWKADGTGYIAYGQNYLGNDTPVYIAPGQGFFVACPSVGSGHRARFNESMIFNGVPTTTDDFIQGDLPNSENEILIKIFNHNEFLAETKLFFNENMSFGLDPGYDLGNFYQNSAISTRLLENDNGINFQIQELPEQAMENAVIPLVINQSAGQEFRINLHTATIPDPNVYLEDVEEGTFTNLYEGDFVYTPTSDLSGVGRFFIHMSPDTMSNEEVSTSMLNAYKKVDASFITIEGLATQTNETNVSLYNILGREVLSTTLNNNMNTQTISTVGLSAGIYVIELESGTDRLTKKLIIK